MRGALPVLVVVLVVAGCAGKPAGPAADTPSGSSPEATVEATGMLVGKIVDDEYLPLAGATVTVLASSQEATSDAGGTFRMGRVPVGSQNVRFQAAGFVVIVRNVQIVEETATDVGVVELARLPDGGNTIRYESLAPKTARIVCALGSPSPGVSNVPKDDQCSKNGPLAGSDDPSIVTFDIADFNFSAMLIQADWTKSSPTARTPTLAFYLTGAVLEAERDVVLQGAWSDGTNDLGIEGLPGYRWTYASKFVDKPLWRNLQAPLKVRAMAADGNATIVQNPAGVLSDGSGLVANQDVEIIVTLAYGTNIIPGDLDAFKDP